MERYEVKSEEGAYLIVEYSSSTEQIVENSEDLFCKPYYQESLDVASNDTKYTTSTTEQSRDEKEKAVWLDKHCRLLIALYKEERPNVGKTYELKTKEKLWQHIAERMHEHGSYFTANQVKGKWKTFERAFYNRKNKTKEYPYAKDLSELLLRQPVTTPTDHQSVKTEESGIIEEQLLRDTGCSPTEEQSSTLSIGSESSLSEEEGSMDSLEEPPERPKRSKSILEELQMWREEFSRERKAKKKYRYAKLKAYKKRTAIQEKQMKQKQKLLETLLESHNKIS